MTLRDLLTTSFALTCLVSPAWSADKKPAAAAPPAASLPAPAVPAAAAAEPAAKPAADWVVDLGVGGIAVPRFEGSNRFLVLPVPYVGVTWRDTVFASVKDGLGANLYSSEVLKFGPVARLNLGRQRSNDKRYLTGLADVDPTAEIGGFLRYSPLSFLTGAVEVRQGVGGHQGLVGELSLDVAAPPLLEDRLFLSAGPRASFSDRRYNEAFFGVTAAESARSGFAAYAPDGGFKSVGAGAGVIYRVTDTFTFTLFGDYNRLVGPAAKSPIVKGKGGSENQFTIGSAITYRFTY
jgi:outer membrane scaffolding protein for murein synthesis (MipA/OmpV family)